MNVQWLVLLRPVVIKIRTKETPIHTGGNMTDRKTVVMNVISVGAVWFK